MGSISDLLAEVRFISLVTDVVNLLDDNDDDDADDDDVCVSG